MGLSDTLSGFFRDEYQRFMKGLDGLTLSERDRFLASSRRDRLAATKPKILEIPAWSDVFHLSPRLDVTREQRDEYWAAVKARRAPQLGAEVVDEIERRRARTDSMRRSAQPDFDQAYGSVHTALDNVQDFLGSISVLGRLAISIGARFGLYAIPGLGQVKLAADVLVWAMFLGQFAFPLWLALCAGPREALRAGVGIAATNLAFKRGSALLARGSAASLRWTKRSAFSAERIAGAIGAVLVLGQTTDQLFGYGISLGPVVGATMGASYCAELIARGERCQVRASPSVEHFLPRVHERLVDVPAAALWDRLVAADVLSQAALVLHANSPATDEERVVTLAAVLAAIGVLGEDWRGTGFQDDLPRLVGWEPPVSPRAGWRVGWQDFVEPGATLPALQWPHSWGGKGYMAPQAVATVTRGISDAVEGMRRSRRAFPDQAFIGAAVTDATEALWLLWTDDPELFRREFTPEWLLLERMGASGFLPHPGNAEPPVQAFWDAARALHEKRPRALQTFDEWRQLAELHKVDYIRTVPAAISEAV